MQRKTKRNVSYWRSLSSPSFFQSIFFWLVPNESSPELALRRVQVLYCLVQPHILQFSKRSLETSIHVLGACARRKRPLTKCPFGVVVETSSFTSNSFPSYPNNNSFCRQKIEIHIKEHTGGSLKKNTVLVYVALLSHINKETCMKVKYILKTYLIKNLLFDLKKKSVIFSP